MAKVTTVGELKKTLEKYDDDLPVGGLGHFGEVLEIDVEGPRVGYNRDWRNDPNPFRVLELYMEDKGPEPD